MNRMNYIYTFAFLISFSCFAQTGEEFVIKFKSNIKHEQITAHLRQIPNLNNWRFITSEKNHPLSRIIKFNSSSFSPENWNQNNDIEYIESLPETFLATDTLPSDPYHTFQWEQDFLHTAYAWNLLNTNDTNFLVGVVDSGADFDHEDLQNYYTNTLDPINGIDDDGNGFIDDNLGWDFGEYDNNTALTSASAHGRQMTSLVAATTNNSLGVSAISYNVKYIPAKITKDNGVVLDPYEGVVYVADQGVKVINCSWYQNASTQYSKDIIDYAASKDIIIVASAGNENSNTPVYPASYSKVIGVGSIDESGLKTNSSNFGEWVDIYAPGQSIYVAYPNHSYFTNGGTSVASAITTSVCCLLRKLFPNETSTQIANRLIRTGNNISDSDISGKYINLKAATQSQIISQFQIFPNPNSTGKIFIDLPFVNENSPIVLEVYNLIGQLVYSDQFTLNNGDKTLETQLNLINGQYIIAVEAENIRKTTKFTLAR